MPSHHFDLDAPHGFSLTAAADFYAGFAPMGGAARRDDAGLELTQLLEGSWAAVRVRLTQRGARLEVRATTSAPVADLQARLTAQLRRMLGLDVDGRAWLAAGARDETLGRVQREFPGFFTAGFPSPYEAGVSGVLSHRSSVKQAAATRRALASRHGELVGETAVIPSPQRLLALRSFPSIPAGKLETLHTLARAALEGQLDAEALRALPVDEALARLERMRGVGPWTASHLLLRGASVQDALPLAEPRVLRAFAFVSGRPEADFARAAQAWRPFRMWAAILLVRSLARAGGWAAVPSDFTRRGRVRASGGPWSAA